MTPAPVISVIMPARNEGARVGQALRSFAMGRSALFPLEIVVVDDASEDGCCNGLENLLSWERDQAYVRVIRLNRWSGIPYARNRGAGEARGSTLFITDANVEASPGWDIPVRRDLRPDRALCATIADRSSSWRGYGCLLDLPSMGVRWICAPFLFGRHVPISPCTGMVIPAALFRLTGGYDTAMPIYGAAEPEFSVRLWLRGAEIIQCPDLVLTHRFRPPGERQPFLEQIADIQMQNYLRFGILYLDEAGIIRLLHHYQCAAPARFQKALRHLAATDVWARRQHLRDRLAHDFSWYMRRFQLQFVGEHS